MKTEGFLEKEGLMTILESCIANEYNKFNVVSVQNQSFDSIINSADDLVEKLGKIEFRKTFPLLSILNVVVRIIENKDVGLNDLKFAYQNYSILMRLSPDSYLLKFWYIKLRIQLFRNDEYFDNDLIAFYEDVINNYDFIFEIDDFYAETELLNINITREFWLQDAVLELFERSVQNKPSCQSYVYSLATIYLARDEYSKIFNICNKYLELNAEIADFDRFSRKYKAYMKIHEVIAIAYFSTNQFDKAKEKVDYILANLPFEGFYSEEAYNNLPSDEDYPPLESYEEFIQALLIRMSINKQENNIIELEADAKILNNGWIIQLEQWKEWYPLVAEYIKPAKEKKIEEITKL